MSLPGIFAPVRHDGTSMLTAVYSTIFPAALPGRWGTDLVLGVHLETSPRKPTQP